MASRKPTEFADPELEAQRRQTLAELESLHGTRAIGAEEYRQRAEVARRAQDEHELLAVRPSPAERATPAPPPAPPAPAAPPVTAAPAREPSHPREPSPRDALPPEGEDVGTVFAVLGGAERKGPWEPPETLNAYAVLGGVELDFRFAALLEGVTEVNAVAVLGGVDITVPDDVDVEVNGIAVLGSFGHVSQHLPGGDRPLIRVSGVAILGSVEVKVKPMPSESTMDKLKQRVRELL